MSTSTRGTRPSKAQNGAQNKKAVVEEEEECHGDVCVVEKPTKATRTTGKTTNKATTEKTIEKPITEKVVTEEEPKTTTSKGLVKTISKNSRTSKVVESPPPPPLPSSPPPEEQEAPPELEEEEHAPTIGKKVDKATGKIEANVQIDDDEEPEEEKKSPILFELFTEEGKAMKTLLDMAFWLMPSDLHFIWTPEGVFYSDSDKGGQLIMQFQLYADKLGRYKPPWKLKDVDDAMIISTGSKDMLNNTKACIKDTTLAMIVRKDDVRRLRMEVGSKNSSPIVNHARIGGDAAYRPVDVPMYPEGLRASIKVKGKEFNDKWKGLSPFGTTAEIVAQKNALMSNAGASDGNSSAVPFGIWNDKTPEIFRGTFSTAMLGHIAKAGTISAQVLIYVVPNKPLKIVADIGSLGMVMYHLYAAKTQ